MKRPILILMLVLMYLGTCSGCGDGPINTRACLNALRGAYFTWLNSSPPISNYASTAIHFWCYQAERIAMLNWWIDDEHPGDEGAREVLDGILEDCIWCKANNPMCSGYKHLDETANIICHNISNPNEPLIPISQF